jgi:hypothetical protein
MKKALKIIALVLLGLVVGVVLVLGYLGFVPGLSTLFGSDKPRDLGVENDPVVLAQVLSDTKVEMAQLEPGLEGSSGVAFEGQVEIKQAFDSKELTAIMTNCKWRYCMMSEPQVRVNADGSVEVSGLVHFDRIDGYAARFDMPVDRLNEALDALKLAPSTMPIYVKGRPSATGDQVGLNIEKIELGRLPAPQDQVEKYAGEIDNFVESQLAQVPGFSMNSVSVAEGELTFDGTHPAKVSVSP